jgi:DNA (cytosine-5)-methyltransferase 1
MASPPLILDLFAGAGGFSVGFSQAGFHPAVAVESDLWASDTYRYNHSRTKVVSADIKTISALDLSLDNLSTISGIIGGPPCQGFSIANNANGDPKDPRNSLFVEYLRIASDFRPAFILIENVPNLLKAKTSAGRLVIDIIHEELRTLGYHSQHAILDATDFGVPQIRRRLFIFGSQKRFDGNPFPAPTHSSCQDGVLPNIDRNNMKRTPTLWEAISDLPLLKSGQGAEEAAYTQDPTNSYQLHLRQDNSILYNHKAMNHSARMIMRFAAMKWGESGNDVPFELRPRMRNSNQVAASAYDQNNRRMHPGKPCHTIPASFYANFVHPYQDRNFTAREGARLQSFPDSYRFLGKPTVVSHKLLAREGRISEKHLCQYSQIGNAVPPLLAEAIALHILKELSL